MASGKPQKSVFIETSALIPMLEQGSVIQARVLQYLKSGKALVCMDTVVVSEYLAGLDASMDKNAVVERMSKQFRIHTFDAHTAIVCSEMFRILKTKGADSEDTVQEADHEGGRNDNGLGNCERRVRIAVQRRTFRYV